MISRRRMRRIIRESFQSFGGRGDWLGDWYEDNGGYYKDADCFYILDECQKEGIIGSEDAMYVCEELSSYGINTLEDLKQNWINQRTDPCKAWLAMLNSMESLQDLIYQVDDWRDEKYGKMGRGGNRFPPAIGPDSPHAGGPA